MSFALDLHVIWMMIMPFVLDLHGYLDDDNALCTRSTRLFGFFSTDHE